MTPDELPAATVGLRLARITRGEDLILCEGLRFAQGREAVCTVLRRARISGRVDVEGKIANHFADLLDDHGDIVGTVALDAGSYAALKNRWARCKVQPAGKEGERTP